MVGTRIFDRSRRHALSEHSDPVLRHLTDLAELGSVVGPALAPFSAAERLQDLVDAARQVFAAGACSIALLDEAEQNLVFEAASGRGADRVVGTVIPIGSGLAGWVVSSGQTLEISEVADDPRFARDVAEQTGYVPRTLLAAPLETRDGTVGVVEVLDRGTGDDQGERDLVTLALFARLAAETVVSARLFTQMGTLLLERAGHPSLRRTGHGPRPGRRAGGHRRRPGRPGRAVRPPAGSRPAGATARPRRTHQGPLVRRLGAARMTWTPAWAWQFAEGHRSEVEGLGLTGPISRDWAWGGATGAGVKVAVVDSGVEDGHPAVGRLAGAVAVEIDAETGETVHVDGPHEDWFGHGTACAGIVRRAAPDCELYSVRVLGANLRGRAAVFAAGVRWALANGMQVANLSLGTGRASQFARSTGSPTRRTSPAARWSAP